MTNNPIQKPADVPLEDTTKVSVDWLKLDRENPRLVGISARTTDESIVAQLYRGEELGELLQSISANGYLDIEPLIVWLDPADRNSQFSKATAGLRPFVYFANLRLSMPSPRMNALRSVSLKSAGRLRHRLPRYLFIASQTGMQLGHSSASNTSTVRRSGNPTPRQNSRPDGTSLEVYRWRKSPRRSATGMILSSEWLPRFTFWIRPSARASFR